MQFAINIDDERIVDVIEQKAADKIINDIEKDVREAIFCKSYYSQHLELNDKCQSIVKQFLEENKKEISELVAKNIAERAVHYKEIQSAKKKFEEEAE